MSFDLSDKTILITGAGSGIGRALAIAAVKAGGVVYALCRQQAHLDSLVEEYPAIKPVRVDLSDWDATREELEKLGPIDCLVNNAAISVGGEAALDASKGKLDEILAVNLYAAINTMQVIGKTMVDAGKGGSIVNVSSTLGINPMQGMMPYNISKAALDMATKQFALELGPHKIRVNSVNPFTVKTDMSRAIWENQVLAEKLWAQTPLGRFAEIKEVVGPILYLLSDCSSMVTGTTNPIEGGLLSNISF